MQAFENDTAIREAWRARHALVAEDNVIIALDAADILNELGAAKVHIAQTVREALDILAAHPVAIALVDVDLGGASTEQVTATLSAAAIPFALTTGHSTRDNKPAGTNDAPVLDKPYNEETLRQTIMALLSRSN